MAKNYKITKRKKKNDSKIEKNEKKTICVFSKKKLRNLNEKDKKIKRKFTKLKKL
jgi:hypothetical protein